MIEKEQHLQYYFHERRYEFWNLVKKSNTTEMRLKFIGFYALIPCFGLWLSAMIFAIKIEQIKKNHNIQSYKEIVAFTEGKRLDELKQIEENAKRPYQKILSVLLTVFITVFICGFMYIIFR